MAAKVPRKAKQYVENLRQSGLTIYDAIEVGDPKLWIPTTVLQLILDQELRGISLAGLPLRTRSKIVKEHVCRALGYPVPRSFLKTKPRFPGQFFDTYVQKSNNLQVWNEELAPARRYVLIRASSEDVIRRVKVVTGEVLAKLDTTGTLTQKYQARCVPSTLTHELIVAQDTDQLQALTVDAVDLQTTDSPAADPEAGKLLTIREIFARLKSLVGVSFAHRGRDQERNRGAELHRFVCQRLGYASYQDDGQFPDVRHQLLEVKLQTSATIDLGLILPSSVEVLDVPNLNNRQIRHCDVRYAVFYATTDGNSVTLTHLFLTTGEAFASRFTQFQGKVLNKKLQIPLPGDFFDR